MKCLLENEMKFITEDGGIFIDYEKWSCARDYMDISLQFVMPHEKPACRISSDFRTEISGIKSARKICSVYSIFQECGI